MQNKRIDNFVINIIYLCTFDIKSHNYNNKVVFFLFFSNIFNFVDLEDYVFRING